LKMMELIARFPQQFITTAWKANFTFLPSNIQLIKKKIWNYLALWTSSFQVGSVKDFQWQDLEKAWVTQNLVSSQTWYDWSPRFNPFILHLVMQLKTPLLNLTEREKSRNTTRWSSITLESHSYSMQHNAVPMHTSCTIGGPTLHHFQFYNWLWNTPLKTPTCKFLTYWMIRALTNQLWGKRNLLGFLRTQ
jgi:hypothetical protein